jgi:hypothetical protein
MATKAIKMITAGKSIKYIFLLFIFLILYGLQSGIMFNLKFSYLISPLPAKAVEKLNVDGEQPAPEMAQGLGGENGASS